MEFKTCLYFCIQTFVVQYAASQFLGPAGLGPIGPGIGPIGAGLGPISPGIGPIGSVLGPIGTGLSPIGSGFGPIGSSGVGLGAIGAGLGPIGSIGTGISGFGPGLPFSNCAGASNGGGFPVTSASPIAPTGVSIVSENAIEGALTVGGNLPLLGSVSVEGAFPTAGAGAISYGCGDGAIGIFTESPIATGIVGPGLNGPIGLNGPLRFGPGASCGAIY